MVLNLFKKVIAQNRKINTLENENETLKNTIKDELYKEFMKKLGEPLEMARLRKENKKLRKQKKELQKIICEGQYGKWDFKSYGHFQKRQWN